MDFNLSMSNVQAGIILHSHFFHIHYFQTYVCNHLQQSVVFLFYDQCISRSCTSEEETEEVVSVDYLEVITTVFVFSSLTLAYWCHTSGRH
jgi:hypothetical protein